MSMNSINLILAESRENYYKCTYFSSLSVKLWPGWLFIWIFEIPCKYVDAERRKKLVSLISRWQKSILVRLVLLSSFTEIYLVISEFHLWPSKLRSIGVVFFWFLSVSLFSNVSNVFDKDSHRSVTSSEPHILILMDVQWFFVALDTCSGIVISESQEPLMQ